MSEREQELMRYGYILAMRVMQSELIITDEEAAAMDCFITREQIQAMVYDEPLRQRNKQA